jgi:hypothetical protein
MTVTRERFLNDAAIVDKLYAQARRERSRMLKAFFSRIFSMHNTPSICGGVNVQGRAAQG